MRRSLLLKPAAAAALVLAACGPAVPQTGAKPQDGKKPGEVIEKVETVVVETPAPAAAAAVPPAVRKDALRLIELMKIVETEMKAIDPLFEQFKQRAPQVPARVWDEAKQELLKEFNPQSLRDAYVPLFASKFTPAELRSLVRFYSSPVGQKFVEKMVEVEAEAFMIGVERGMRIGERVRARLKSLGYESNIG